MYGTYPIAANESVGTVTAGVMCLCQNKSSGWTTAKIYTFNYVKANIREFRDQKKALEKLKYNVKQDTKNVTGL